jgi:CxxC motif-containing protein (DUF1111 family)
MFNSRHLFITIMCTGLAAMAAEKHSVKTPGEFPEKFAGGEGSTYDITGNAFTLPMRNITKTHQKDFVVGRSIFRQNWVAAPSSVESLQGLGPTFNNQSCIACHTNDGRGRPPLNNKEEISSILFRVSIPGQDAHGGPKPVPAYGDQLNPRAIMDVLAEGDVTIILSEVKGEYPDGEKYSLMKPKYKLENLNYGKMPDDVMISPRTAPAMIGLGLLETIPESDILKNADPNDKDKDGIAGRPNYVWDFAKNKKSLGRFGWKANQPSLFQQNQGALNGDMGVTSALFPKQNCPDEQESCQKAYALNRPEISVKDVVSLTNYTKTVSVPVRRQLEDIEEIRGQALMKEAQCIKCHVPHYRTGVDKKFPELSNQDIYPFTDLLLHDMGEELADNRPDYEATGRQWRTPPLWGVGLVKVVNGHTRFMHDGRARNIEEAILWHGGEAQAAKDKFSHFKKEDRVLLVKYVESL